MPKQLIDIHQHLVYGLDDGADSRHKMLKMLAASEKQGISYVFATAHVQPGRKPFKADLYKERVEQANEWLSKAGKKLKVLYGAEVFYSREVLGELDKGAIPTMNGTDYVLVEFHPSVEYMDLYNGLREIANGGYLPILAHMERYRCLHVKTKEKIAELRIFRAGMQMNSNTIIRGDRLFGGSFINTVMKNKLVDYIASDAHGMKSRPVNLLDGYDTVAAKYGRSFAEEIFCKNQLKAFID